MKKIIIALGILIILSGCTEPQTQQHAQYLPSGLSATAVSPEAIDQANKAILRQDPTQVLQPGKTGLAVNMKCIGAERGIYWFLDGTKVKEKVSTGYAMNNGEYIYRWDENTEFGGTKSPANTKYFVYSNTNYADWKTFFELEGITVKCEEGIVTEADFEVPGNVKFEELDFSFPEQPDPLLELCRICKSADSGIPKDECERICEAAENQQQ